MSNTHVQAPSAPMPKRSSMKRSTSSPISLENKVNREKGSPTVRFAETEPPSRSSTRSASTSTFRPQPGQWPHRMPTPLLYYSNHRRASIAGPITRKVPGENMKSYNATRPSSMLITRPRRLSTQSTTPGTGQSYTVSAPPSSLNSTTPLAPLSTRNSLPPLPSSCTTYYHSHSSKGSVPSSPAVPSTPHRAATPSGQYDPLQHYLPCLYLNCSAYYTPPHSGSMYYVPQGPYSLTRLHGYCPRHVTQELADATALCKLEWEKLRQSAGRKTLGQIARDFDIFMEQFRETRHAEDAQLQQDLASRVVHAAATLDGKDATGTANLTTIEWDWRYTPRRCITSGCKSPLYSPFASHLYAFYSLPRPSTFAPLPTLCPACATAEVEAFEKKVAEKRASRSDGAQREWAEWLGNATRDREMEVEFWEKAQERSVRGRGVAKKVESIGVSEQKEREMEKEKQGSGLAVWKRKSVFKRLLSSIKV